MRGGSFDSPTADGPSSHQLRVPTQQLVVCCQPSSNGDADAASPWKREIADVLGGRSSPSSQRRTRSAASLRLPPTDVTDFRLTDRCVAASMPNVRWTCDVAAARCDCDATGRRTSVSADGGERTGSSADPDAARTAAATSRRRGGVERPPRVSRSDPDVLKLPPTSSPSNCYESRYSRPSSSSLDRSRSQRDRSPPPSCDTLQLLPLCHQ